MALEFFYNIYCRQVTIFYAVNTAITKFIIKKLIWRLSNGGQILLAHFTLKVNVKSDLLEELYHHN